MACPSCGQKFYSDFKLDTAGPKGRQGLFTQIFTLPDTLFQRLLRYFSAGR